MSIALRTSDSVQSRCVILFFFQAEDGIRDLVRSRGLGDVYKRQGTSIHAVANRDGRFVLIGVPATGAVIIVRAIGYNLSLIHI